MAEVHGNRKCEAETVSTFDLSQKAATLPVQLGKAIVAEDGARRQVLDEASDGLCTEMEALSMRLKDLVLSQPAEELLGYIWCRFFLQTVGRQPCGIETLQIAMEYIHAVLSCFDSDTGLSTFNEATAEEILDVSEKLKNTSLYFCMASSNSEEGAFGDQTADVEFHSKMSWLMIRGHRYQALEEEFFFFVLSPHEEAIRRAYGIGAEVVAKGIQSITDSMRMGFGEAAEEIGRQRAITYSTMEKHGQTLEEVTKLMKEKAPETIASLQAAFMDLFRAGVCNLSRHTQLPRPFLEDLAFRRGENTEFYEAGQLCGTPFRTLPARVKPLIELNNEFYATDIQFVRDASYRAIQRGLISRLPDYREEWKQKQTKLTEAAFARIFAHQLQEATVLNEVYYRDVQTKNWVENDTLILLGDVLLQIEAKGGIAAMDSPALNFNRHVRAIQDLVVKAYRQTKRFFDYLNSAPEVPLYELRAGEYVEIRRVRLSQYRLVVPIGLTVENFSPFSTMCKNLPEVQPLLGQYPFVSMSIDDLFVLNRFLPTVGELFHYLEVRQAIAGIKKANLFDEIDHLGAYIEKNRFDLTLQEQFSSGADMVACDAFSSIVDNYFEKEDWQGSLPPSQEYPMELKSLFDALNRSRFGSWLKADSLIRNLGAEGRTNLAETLKNLIRSLKERPQRWFALRGDFPILFWLHREDIRVVPQAIVHEAEVVTLAAGNREVSVILLSIHHDGSFVSARAMQVKAPPILRTDYSELLAEAEAAKARTARLAPTLAPRFAEAPKKNLRPNDRCWCGSGNKFKKCHGNLVL